MSRTLATPELAEQAVIDAARAAELAGVDVVNLDDIDGLAAATALWAAVWGPGAEAQIPRDLLRAMTHAGNYASGAYHDGRLVGALAGFLGSDDGGVYLHSHILGVFADHRGGNVGFALKQHQRAWALAKGIQRITWTFDPLVRRNAHFNLHKLGAEASAYHESFYGPMTDSVNEGDESDRLVITWHLAASDVVEAASGRLPEFDADDLISAGAAVNLMPGEEDEPVVVEAADAMLLCATPEDVLALRRERPQRALRWRHALRDTLGAAMHDGFTVRGFTRSGWYVLVKDGRALR
jgi:predicted GNAT superfamily acetyltransferase